MTRVTSLTAIVAAVVGWFASVLLLREALGHSLYAAGNAVALAGWSIVAVLAVEAVRHRNAVDRLTATALTASAGLFAVLALSTVA